MQGAHVGSDPGGEARKRGTGLTCSKNQNFWAVCQPLILLQPLNGRQGCSPTVPCIRAIGCPRASRPGAGSVSQRYLWDDVESLLGVTLGEYFRKLDAGVIKSQGRKTGSLICRDWLGIISPVNASSKWPVGC